MNRSTSRHAWQAAACAALALALAACDKTTTGASATAAGPQASAPAAKDTPKADASESYTAKLNAYTEAYNKLIGSSGLPATRKGYFDKQIASKRPTDDVFISKGWVDQGLAALKQARKLPDGALADLDKTADALTAALEPLMAQLAELDVYYQSKAYKDDGLAKGKAQDPVVRAGFDAGMAALTAFNEALTREHRKRDEQLLAALKAEGNLRMYNIKLGLQQAERIVNLFGDVEDLKKPEKFTQGDLLVAELEQTLAEQRKVNAGLGNKDANAMNHEGLTAHLTALVGEYRELKQTRQANAFNSMVHKYNAAVGAANAISE